MSRSRRKSPIHGMVSCDSEAKYKARASRAIRSAVRRALAQATDFDGLSLPLTREVSNFQLQDGNKDGKFYFGGNEDNYVLLRK